MTENRPSTYTPAGKPNAALTIMDGTSHPSSFYQIHVPFFVSYEFCSGSGEDDYINFISFSCEGYHFSQESFSHHNAKLAADLEHSHDYYEFMIVLKGTVRQKIEGKEFRYPPGSCCVIGRRLRHFEGFDREASILFLGLSVEYAQNLFASARTSAFKEERQILATELSRFLSDDHLIPNQNGKFYLDFIPTFQNGRESVSFMHDFMTDMTELLLNPTFGTYALATGFLSRLMNFLSSDHYHCTHFDLSCDSDSLLFSRIDGLMRERYGRLSREELANELNYSSDYLSRIVKKRTGMCLHDYGMTFCLQRAAFLLKSTDDTIEQIASELKFASVNKFYKVFKSHYHMTPTEYRRHCAANEKQA